MNDKSSNGKTICFKGDNGKEEAKKNYVNRNAFWALLYYLYYKINESKREKNGMHSLLQSECFLFVQRQKFVSKNKSKGLSR